jgi:hypothetical protein
MRFLFPARRNIIAASVLAVALGACCACDSIKKSMLHRTVDRLYEDGSFVDSRGRLVITQFGITWHFDRSYDYGRFANGDYWVVGPVRLIRIFPDSWDDRGRIRNGSMINPSPGLGNRQGYDSACYATVYDPDLNVGLYVHASRKLEIPAGSSLVTSASLDEPGGRPQLRTAAVLTVLENAPPQGSFRPPYCGIDKAIGFNKDQLNYSLLTRLTPVAGAPPLAQVERYFERPWIDHIPGWSSGSIHPLENMRNYGRDLTGEMSMGALMLHLDLTDSEKETLLVRFVQLGIDCHGIVEAGGRQNWHNDGGHASGRKWPILFAGMVLGHEGMRNIGQKSGDYLYSGDYGPGNIPPDYVHFGEDDQTFHVSADDIALAAEVTIRPGTCGGTFYGHYYRPECRDYPEYEASDSGMAEWGIRHSSDPLSDGNIWDASYRQCCTAITWSGFVLAARIMGANRPELWNHAALFDYQDRYMAVTATADIHPLWRGSTGEFISGVWASHPGWRGSGFTASMWDEYRHLY